MWRRVEAKRSERSEREAMLGERVRELEREGEIKKENNNVGISNIPPHNPFFYNYYYYYHINHLPKVYDVVAVGVEDVKEAVEDHRCALRIGLGPFTHLQKEEEEKKKRRGREEEEKRKRRGRE